MDKVAALLLTAGSSSRMGEPKALLSWGPKTVIQHILDQIQEAGLEKVLLVTGAHHQEIQTAFRGEPIPICYHRDWELGMGSSISKGIQAIEQQFVGVSAVLVLLVDQPLISSAYLRELTTAHSRNSNAIIASDYGDFAGVPALFPREFWDALKQIPTGQGAKGLIARFREQCSILNPAEAIVDIDTPEAYQQALKLAGILTT